LLGVRSRACLAGPFSPTLASEKNNKLSNSSDFSKFQSPRSWSTLTLSGALWRSLAPPNTHELGRYSKGAVWRTLALTGPVRPISTCLSPLRTFLRPTRPRARVVPLPVPVVSFGTQKDSLGDRLAGASSVRTRISASTSLRVTKSTMCAFTASPRTRSATRYVMALYGAIWVILTPVDPSQAQESP